MSSELSTDLFKEQLANARRELLDLSGRNRLLNFRPTKRTTIPIVDEVPNHVWLRLVKEQKPFAFRAREDHPLLDRDGSLQPTIDTEKDTERPEDEAVDLQDGEVFDVPNGREPGEDGELPERHTDSFLQTALTGENLQTNLLRLEQQARSALEERGVELLPIVKTKKRLE